MVIEVDKATTALAFKQLLKRLQANRAQRRPNMAQFFGALPNIGDGLELQKAARNEWS